MADTPARVAARKNRRRKPRNRVVRTYVLPHAANPGKVARVAAVLSAWQETSAMVQAWQWRRLLSGEGLWNRADDKHIPTRLSARQRKSVVNQVVDGLRSWEALTEEHVRDLITGSALDPDTRRWLYRVNARRAWYAPDLALPRLVVDPATGEETTDPDVSDPVPAEVMHLARRLVKHVKRHRHRVPDLSRGRTMHMDGPIAVFEVSRTGRFAYWLRISTLEKRKPVWLPLGTHSFAEDAPGEWAPLTQVSVRRDGTVRVAQVKESLPAPARRSGDGPVVGLDWGMTSLFATSEGDLLGRRLYPWLCRQDAALSTLAANLQRQGIKPSTSKRYRGLQRRIRAHVRNEVGRVLNRVMAVRDPAELVVEQLDFRGPGLSSRMNRLVTRAGRAAVTAKLKSLTQTTGVRVATVPAAHTSRQCSGCGYTVQSNRNGAAFRCAFCGKTSHADVDAARTIRSRRSWPARAGYWSKEAILRHLDEEFAARWGTPPPRADATPRRVKQRKHAHHRRARTLTTPGNPAAAA